MSGTDAEERKAEVWNLPLPSRETLDFVGQLLELQSKPRPLQTLGAVLAAGGEGARVALCYWLRARELGYPQPHPARVNLAGADQEEWRIKGGADQPLDLRGADLSGAKLNRCRIENVQLAGANLARVELRQAVLQSVWAMEADLRGSDLCGMQWQMGSLAGAQLTGMPETPTQLDGVQWLGVDLTGAGLPPDWQEQASAVGCRGVDPDPAVSGPTGRQFNTGA